MSDPRFQNEEPPLDSRGQEIHYDPVTGETPVFTEQVTSSPSSLKASSPGTPQDVAARSQNSDYDRNQGTGGQPVDPPMAMSIEHARQLLASRFDVFVPENDPQLMSVVLHQGFVRDMEQLLGRHDKAHTKVMEVITATSAKTIIEAVEPVRDRVIQVSLENTLAEISERGKQSQKLTQSLKTFALYMTLLTIICLGSFGGIFYLITHKLDI